MYMAVSRLFLCTKPVGAQEVPKENNQKQDRSRNGQKWVVFRKFFEKIEALYSNIGILISKYAPECERYRKNRANKIYFFFGYVTPYIFPII